jgi:hypothetical protein
MRRQVRRYGALAGLLVPGLVFAAGYVYSRSWPCSGSTCWTKGEVGFMLAELAAPTLLAVGWPLDGGTVALVIAGATSVLLWLAVGAWAARRAARSPVASWRDYWREYVWLLAGVWVGVAIALVVVRTAADRL